MAHGGGGDVEFEVGADGAADAVLPGGKPDFAGLANAAILSRIDADQIAGLVANQLAGVNEVKAHVVRHDGQAAFAADAGDGRVVAVGRRLLDEVDPAVGELLDAGDGRVGVPAAVGVDDELAIEANNLADGSDACDVVVLPSTWEGFGNPTIESIAARRPLAAFPYPVLAEIRATGVRLFSTSEPATVVRFLHEPQAVRDRFYDVNVHRARLSYALEDLPADLERLLS